MLVVRKLWRWIERLRWIRERVAGIPTKNQSRPVGMQGGELCCARLESVRRHERIRFSVAKKHSGLARINAGLRRVVVENS